MFVGSSQTDSLTAYDTRSGERLWEFRAEGPIRFAPVAWNGKLYVASDDGHLYCVDAADGRARWKHRGGPSNRRVLGNERLISLWPARGGPVVANGHGLLRGRHLAIHGHFHARPRCRNRRGAVDQ